MRKPKYRRHSTRDFAFVEWKGERHRLPGQWNSPESRDAYQRFVDRHVYGGRPAVATADSIEPRHVTIAVIVSRFLRWARGHYPGNPTRNEYSNCKHAVAAILKLFPTLPAAEFGPLKLKQVRQEMELGGNSRHYINAQVGRIKRMFRWAASEELVSAVVWQSLDSVTGLRRGQTKAKETARRVPVPWENVLPVFEHLNSTVAAMLWLQWYTGARSQSVCMAKPEQFDRKAVAVWLWRPRHKTENRDIEIVLPIGPKCQAALAGFIDREPGDFMFNPRDVRGNRRYNRRYSALSYRQAVRRAQVRAKVPQWTPHQLRHARATMVRGLYGLEAAQAVLAHETVDATQIYARNQLERATKVAIEIG